MTKTHCLCPFCKAQIAYNWETDQILFTSEYTSPTACEHTAYVGIFCRRGEALLPYRNTTWLRCGDHHDLAERIRWLKDGDAVPGASYETVELSYLHQHDEGVDGVTVFAVFSLDPNEFLGACLADI